MNLGIWHPQSLKRKAAMSLNKVLNLSKSPGLAHTSGSTHSQQRIAMQSASSSKNFVETAG